MRAGFTVGFGSDEMLSLAIFCNKNSRLTEGGGGATGNKRISWRIMNRDNQRDIIYCNADAHYSAWTTMSCDRSMRKSSIETKLTEEPTVPGA